MKLKREANSFQNVNSEAPTNTINTTSGSSSASSVERKPARPSGHATTSRPSGARKNVATPMSNKAPMAIAGSSGHGASSPHWPL
jgi:hypothetical protein